MTTCCSSLHIRFSLCTLLESGDLLQVGVGPLGACHPRGTMRHVASLVAGRLGQLVHSSVLDVQEHQPGLKKTEVDNANYQISIPPLHSSIVHNGSIHSANC